MRYLPDLPDNELPRTQPKLVLFDVDGTLRNRHGRISPVVTEAVVRVKERGCLIGLATGRPPFAALEIMTALGTTAPSILLSGAVVAGPDGSVRRSFTMPPELASRLLHTARRYEIDIEFYGLDCSWIDRDTELLRIHSTYHPQPAIRVDDLIEIITSTTLYKATLVLDTFAQSAAFAELRAELPDLRFGVAHGAAHPQLSFVNVTPVGVIATTALRHILAELAIAPEETAAFGDGASDLPVLSAVGCGVAMGNASEEVQRAARFVTRTVEEDGVAYALSRIFGLS